MKSKKGKRRFTLPEFNNPSAVTALTTDPTPSCGVRLEPNFLYWRRWCPGTVGGPTTATASYPFASAASPWTEQNPVPQGAQLAYASGTGNPAGSLQWAQDNAITSNITAYWQLSTTWESLGVPAGATVTKIRLNSAYDRCTAGIQDAGGASIGAFTLWNSANNTQVITLLAGRTVLAAEGSWTARIGTDQDVPSGYQASNTSIRLRITCVIDASGGHVHNVDEVIYVITYIT